MSWKRAVLILFGLVVALVIVVPALLHFLVRKGCCENILGDIHTVISAQEAYASANGGFYEGRLPCLSSPATGCIPSYSSTSPTFLDRQLASLVTKDGYARAFYPGPPAPAEEVRKTKASPSSVKCFAYVAVPEKQGQTGVRSFCGDCTGVLGFRLDGGVPAGVEAGRCELGSPRGWDVIR